MAKDDPCNLDQDLSMPNNLAMLYHTTRTVRTRSQEHRTTRPSPATGFFRGSQVVGSNLPSASYRNISRRPVGGGPPKLPRIRPWEEVRRLWAVRMCCEKGGKGRIPRQKQDGCKTPNFLHRTMPVGACPTHTLPLPRFSTEFTPRIWCA
jgi:hypothetical protein